MSLKQFGILFFLSAGIFIKLNGQMNTMYYLSGAPQSYLLNPASQPTCGFFLGFPVNLYVEYDNDKIDSYDLVWKHEQTGEPMTPFHEGADLDAFLEKFDDVNSFNVKNDIIPFSFGFGVKNMYFTFDIRSVLEQDLIYPKDLVRIMANGISNNATYDLSAMGIEQLGYVESGIGVSMKINDQLSVGLRPKVLFGQSLISSVNNDVTLSTSNEEWVFDSEFQLQIASPWLNIPTDENGNLDIEEGIGLADGFESVADLPNVALKNMGLGIDLGVHFEPVPGIKLSASAINLGYINWKEQVHTATLNGEYTFEGVVFNSGDSIDFTEYLLDTIKSNFNVDGSSAAFKTSLKPKIFVGGTVSLLPTFDAGLLTRFDFLKTGGIDANVILHGRWMPSRVFNVTASYTPFGGRANSYGLGMSLNLGPLNIFAVADYNTFKYTVLTKEEKIAMIVPAHRSRYNIQLGLNFVLGTNRDKKLLEDKPMYYSTEY